MLRRHCQYWMTAALLTLSACATVTSPPPPVTQAPPLAPAEARDPFRDTLRKSQEEARRLEGEGQIREALERWKIVLTIDPQNAEAKQKKEELEAKVKERYQQHIAAGKGFVQRRDKAAAQKEFLAALRLDPRNREALDLLYQSDEQLGDQTAFARPLRKVEPPARPEAGRPGTAKAPPAEKPMAMEEPEEESGEEISLAEAAELYRRGDYLAAIEAFSRVLVQQPGLREAIEYQKLSYYNQGVAYVEGEHYSDALKMFDAVSKMQPNFKRVVYYTQTAREKLAEQHNLAGIRYFKEQKLKEAIAEWEEALALNPKLESARRSEERAKQLLKRLEEMK